MPVSPPKKILASTLALVNCLFIFSSPSLVLAQVELQYQNRGNWYEGIKPKAVAGYDIELISVLVDYSEDSPTLPDQAKVRFYLPHEKEPVFLTVRELDYKYFYWMDRVRPQDSWDKGYENVFQWPTKTVLQKLGDDIQLYELGALARIGDAKPKSKERIAPVILYHSQLPSKVEGYRFTFKMNGDARITCVVYEENNRKPVWRKIVRRQIGGIPITVNWSVNGAKSGPYRFMIKGFFLTDNTPVHQTIQFYHQADLHSGP